ncbi:MAG TPA: DUF2171 domain-containing protein [Polyangiaceae bacterium]
MVSPSQIKPNMPVVCSNETKFAVVDGMEGDWIRLKREGGSEHYIPLSWVRMVDDSVHIDRPGKQAIQQWSMTPSFDGLKSASRISTREAPTIPSGAAARRNNW